MSSGELTIQVPRRGGGGLYRLRTHAPLLAQQREIFKPDRQGHCRVAPYRSVASDITAFAGSDKSLPRGRRTLYLGTSPLSESLPCPASTNPAPSSPSASP